MKASNENRINDLYQRMHELNDELEANGRTDANTQEYAALHDEIMQLITEVDDDKSAG